MQQINLLNPALIKKTDFLNPNNIALLLGVLLLSLLAYAAMENHALSQLQQSRTQIATQLSTTEKQVEEMRTIQANKNDVATQLKQIQALEQEVMMQKDMIKAIGLNKTGENQSYAAIFKAFSKQSLDGLWITGLNIDQNTEVLSIKGRTVDANLLPQLIANLRHEPALKGKTFTDLSMQSNEKKLSGNNAIANTQTALTNAKAADGQTNPAQMLTPPYMEFVLHSVIDKTTMGKTTMDKTVTDKNASTATGEKTVSSAALDEARIGMVNEGAHH